LEGSGIKGATVNRYLATIKTLLRHHRQPWEHIKLKKENKGRIRVLSKDEELRAVELLLGAELQGKKPYYTEAADLVEVLVDSGMRLSEALNLIIYKDVSFQNNLLSIWVNKGDLPRSTPMTSRIRMIMEERRKRKQSIYAKLFSITVDKAERAWKWVRAEMGLEKDSEFVIHALRHTCASRLVNGGVVYMRSKSGLVIARYR
jgi:integrase